MYSAHIKLLSFFLHPIISEHTAIDFQPSAHARTACTKTSSEIMECRKKLKSLICAEYISASITARNFFENMTKKVEISSPGYCYISRINSEWRVVLPIIVRACAFVAKASFSGPHGFTEIVMSHPRQNGSILCVIHGATAEREAHKIIGLRIKSTSFISTCIVG